MKITNGKYNQPQKVLLYGVEGIGKSTLASAFPTPLFLDCEGGTSHLDVDRVRCTTWEDLMDASKSLYESCDYRTIVVDTADWAEQLCTDHVCKVKSWSGVESPGFGSGYNTVTEEMRKLLNGPLHDLQYRHNVHLVLIAHARIVKFQDPILGAEYDRFALKCRETGKLSTSNILREWADAVLFLNYHTSAKIETQKTSAETTKQKAKTSARTGIRRMCYTQRTAAYDAKNRWGLPDVFSLEPDGDEPYGYAVLKPYVEVPFGAYMASPITDAKKGETRDLPKDSDIEAKKRIQALILELTDTVGGREFLRKVLNGRSLKTMTIDECEEFVSEVREAVRIEKERQVV